MAPGAFQTLTTNTVPPDHLWETLVPSKVALPPQSTLIAQEAKKGKICVVDYVSKRGSHFNAVFAECGNGKECFIHRVLYMAQTGLRFLFPDLPRLAGCLTMGLELWLFSQFFAFLPYCTLSFTQI